MKNEKYQWCPFARCLLVKGKGYDEASEAFPSLPSYNRMASAEDATTRSPIAAKCIKSDCAMWKPGKYQFIGSCGAIK